MKRIIIHFSFSLFFLNAIGQSIDSLGSTSVFYFYKKSNFYLTCFSSKAETKYYQIKIFQINSPILLDSVFLNKDSIQLKQFEKLSRFVFNKYGDNRYNSGRLHLFEFLTNDPKINYDSFYLMQYKTIGGFGMHINNLDRQAFVEKSHMIGNFIFYFRLKKKIKKSEKEIFKILQKRKIVAKYHLR